MNKKIIWVINDESKISDNRIKKIKPKGLSYVYYFTTSGTIITNNSVESWLPVRKKQILLNTWHGGGLGKTIGFRDNIVNPYLKYYVKLQNRKTTAILSGSSFCTKEVMHDSLGYDLAKIIETGLPRNDLFFHANGNIRKKVLKTLNIPDMENVGIILYAPTFRGNSQIGNFIAEKNYPPLKELSHLWGKKNGKKYCILFRAHNAMKIKEIEGTLTASFYPNMQELLYVSDVLITDYSSCMYDFSLMRKPVLLYVPDYNEYISTRGLYKGINNMPFPFAKTKKELIKVTENFDLKYYTQSVEHYLDELGNVECGVSTENVISWLKEKWAKQRGLE